MSVGVYVRRLSKKTHGTPAQMAKFAKEHGLTTVPIMGPWQQPKNGKVITINPNKKKYTEYAKALRDVDVRPIIWGYPWVGHEAEFAASVLAMDDTRADLLLDPELGYKWKTKAKAFTGATSVQCKAGAAKLIERVGPRHLEFTSYGNSKGHPNFPWKVFSETADVLSPQWYTQVYPDWGMHLETDEWSYAELVPSVPLYGKKSGAHLHDYLSNVAIVDMEGGDLGVDGFYFWSWRQASPDEWRIIKRWADWFEAGMCLPRG